MSFERPMCDTPGCEMVSWFHGFGRDICRVCYARIMQNGGVEFYRLTNQIHRRTMPDSEKELTNEEKCGHDGQLSLSFVIER